MACNKQRAVAIIDELMQKPGLKSKEEALLDIKARIVAFGRANVEISSATNLNTEYSRLFKETAKEFLTYTINIDDDVLLSNLRKDVDTIVPGDYDPNTNNIRIVSTAVNELELGLAVMVGVDAKAVNALYKVVDTMPTIEDQTGFVEATTAQPEYKKLVNDLMVTKLAEVMKTMDNLDREHVIVHELTHVAAVKFMKKIPENAHEKAIQNRVHMLFEDAKTRYTAMGGDIKDTVTAYWAKDVNEFLAEALSNSNTIKLLEGMKTGKMGRLSTVLRVLLDALAAIVGVKKNKDNVYYYTLDSVLAMIENKQADTKPNNDIMDKAKAIGAELGLRDELVNETIAKLEKCSKG